jgi:hypothetical protein
MKQFLGSPHWDNRPVILVAGGPSLCGFELGRLAELDAWLVGVNESIFILPRCDAGVSADRMFVDKRFDRLKEKIADGTEIIISTGGSHREIDATLVMRKLTGRLSDKSNVLNTCGTSGYAALNAAYLKRAKRILLLGYDYSADGKHYYDDYEWHKPPKRAGCWEFWARFYDSTRPQLEANQIEVFNASSKSAIKAFPKGTVEQGLQWLKMKEPQREAEALSPASPCRAEPCLAKPRPAMPRLAAQDQV